MVEEDAAALLTAKAQLESVTAVVVEGTPHPEINDVFLPAGEKDGWPSFESKEGRCLFRSVLRDQWYLALSYDPEGKSRTAEEPSAVETPGELPEGTRMWKVWWDKEWQPVETTVTLLRDGQTSLPPAVAALRCKVADVTRDTCVGGSCCLAKEKDYIHQMVLGPADEIGSEMIRLDGMRDGKMAAAQELWMLQRLNILSQLSEADGEVWKAALGLATATRQLTGLAAVVVEGLPKREYNSVYLPAGSHEGWPRFEGGEGTHLFRHVEYAHSFVDWRRPLFFLGRLWPSRNRFSVVLCRLLNSWRQEG